MIEATLRPKGLYSLKLTARTESGAAQLSGGRWAEARQLHDGSLLVRASCERSVDEARFLLALDDDTSEFHRRFARDPLLGPSVRTLRGLRTTRTATVAHAALRAICGQLIQSRRAREIERTVIRTCGESPPTRQALASLSPAALTGCGLAESRAATLARLVRRVDLESLKTSASSTALARLQRERGIGPWSVGVIALQGLGRYDAGLVSDLSLVKLFASLRGRWPEQPAETAELLAPYGEWQGLASVFLLAGFARGLVPGASADRARLVRGATERRRERDRTGREPRRALRAAPSLGEAALITRRCQREVRSWSSEREQDASRMTLIALGHEVVAVDNSSAMLAFVRGAETVLADMETLDLERRFPVVVLASNSIDDPDPEIRRGCLSAARGMCSRVERC